MINFKTFWNDYLPPINLFNLGREMKPLEISLDNCNELLPDDIRRVLSSEARKFADNNIPRRKYWKRGVTYFDVIITEHKKLFWNDVYTRRQARIKRKNEE